MAAGGQAGAGRRDRGQQGRGLLVQPLPWFQKRTGAAFARQGKEGSRKLKVFNRYRGHDAEAGRLSLYVFHLPSLSTPHLPFLPMSHVTLLSKASVRVREVKSVEELMERLNMSLADVAADCGILRCVAKKRPVLEVTDRHGV